MRTLPAADEWAELKSLFGSIIELSPYERQVAAENCNPALRKRLLELLGQYERSTAFLQSQSLTHDRVLEYLASELQAFAPGDLAGERYKIVRFIGQGGMGEVYQAQDRELGGQVALKTIRPELAASAAMIERFKREIQLSRRVTHPNVCRVYDLFWHRSENERGVAFLTMEMLEGDTLAQRLSSGGKVSIKQAPLIARQIAAGLDAAHQAGVVHGDLKAGNVILAPLFDGAERAVITDFGLAYEQGSTENESSRGGTPAYMAPEQWSGGSLTAASDIYSFGMLLFEIFSGRLPCEGNWTVTNHGPPAQLLRRINPDLPRRWDRAIRLCLNRDPELRPRSAGRCVAIAEQHKLSRRWFVAAAAGITVTSGLVLVPGRHPAVDADLSVHMKRASLFLGRRTDSDLRNAVAEYQYVVRRAPKFVAGWLGLSEAYSVSANFHFSDFRSSLAAAIRAAETAVHLDDRSARGYGLLAYCTSINVHRWQYSEPQFLRAVELDAHDPQIRLWYASFLGKRGRGNEAIANLKAGLAEDATSLPLNQQLAWEYFRDRRVDESLRQALDLITLQPRDPMSYIAAARAWTWKGDYARALADAADVDRYGDPLAARCLRASIAASGGNPRLARVTANDLRVEWQKGTVESILLAEIYCRLGDRKEAIDVLNQGMDRWDPSVLKAASHPAFDVLKGDTEYEGFLHRIGLS